MPMAKHQRGVIAAILAVLPFATAALAPVIVTVSSPTRAFAQVSAEFQSALEPYGFWQQHPRFGAVWVPFDLPPGWRPYTYGRWVYTDDWGWYWASDPDEADWGWIVFHYGRWAHDRQLGWFWIPGDEWGPAWVDWRRGDDYVGWAPLPPDEVVYAYDNDPAYWVFVQPRYMVAPRIYTYVLPPQRSVLVLRRTVIVNRTMRIEHRDRGGRIAVNPGIAPGIVAAAARQPVRTFNVQPRVVAGTQGVTGAVQVRPQDLPAAGQRGRRGQPRPGGPSPVQATLQPTQTVVQPVGRVPQAQPLGRDERGRMGPTPPRAAQGAVVAPPASAPSGQPSGLQRVPTPPATPPSSSPVTNPPPPAQPRPERREENLRGGGPPPQVQQGSPPQQPNIVRPVAPQAAPPAPPPPQPQQPNIVRPIPPQATPPAPPPPPQQRQLQPPPPPPQQQRLQPPPPPPPQQRQVQPPPPPPRQVQPPPPRQVPPPPPPQQRQIQPPPPAAARPQQPPAGQAPPPRRPPPKPGEKPPEQPK